MPTTCQSNSPSDGTLRPPEGFPLHGEVAIVRRRAAALRLAFQTSLAVHEANSDGNGIHLRAEARCVCPRGRSRLRRLSLVRQSGGPDQRWFCARHRVPQRCPGGIASRTLPSGMLLAPGFIDLQVNGGGGVLLNDHPTAEAMQAIARAHRRFGTTSCLPTFITDTRDKAKAATPTARRGISGCTSKVHRSVRPRRNSSA